MQIFDDERRRLTGGLENDGVAQCDVLQRPEEPVTMAGDADVPDVSRQCGALDLTDPTVQDQVTGAREDGDFDLEPGNPHQCKWGVHLCEEALLKFLSAADGPQGRVDWF